MVEKRAYPRQRRLKEGRIIFNRSTSLVSCLVRDGSDNGVRVKVFEPYQFPPEFEITIRGEGPARRARRVWMNDSEMGITFTG